MRAQLSMAILKQMRPFLQSGMYYKDNDEATIYPWIVDWKDIPLHEATEASQKDLHTYIRSQVPVHRGMVSKHFSGPRAENNILMVH